MTTTSAAPVSSSGEDLSIGMATVLRMLFQQVDLMPKWDELQARISANHRDAVALHDASLILQGLGKTDLALETLRTALKYQRTYKVVFGTGRGPRILAFVTVGDFMANTPVGFLLAGSEATLLLHYVDADTRDLRDVPAHDVAMVAVAESETNAPVLRRLHLLTQGWQRPVLNQRADMIARLTRDGVSAMFADEPDILSPPTWRAGRADLMLLANNMKRLPDLFENASFPVIIRPIGTHAGGGLDRLESAADLVAYLQAEQADSFYLSPFIDYSGPDGRFTKLRVVQIDGKPFASHLAVSAHWIVHYLSAGMADDPAKRAIEAHWMATFDEDFAKRHTRAFQRMHDTVGLDYFGYDCAELPDGRLLLFELDVAMVVHDMDSEEVYPYKRPTMRKLFDAFIAMVEARASSGTTAPV